MSKTNNTKIRELFSELDSIDVLADEYQGNYWEIKLRLVEEITGKYGDSYSPELIKTLRIPCAICSIIVEMERQKLNI